MNTDQHQLTREIILELQEINVNYGGIQALKKVNLTINKGEVVTLVGANGAGKTTTLKAISKMLNCQGGNIIYQGRNIN
ncbi:MAG: ATP-binding cassette domain-containing protein, partial [Dolichospermum sp.]